MLKHCLPALLMFVALTQAPPKPEPEPYPGAGTHQRPPAGWYCSPNGKGPHKCECKRVAHKTEDDPFCENQDPPESPTCRVWCFAQFCLCEVKCEMPEHQYAAHTGPAPEAPVVAPSSASPQSPVPPAHMSSVHHSM